MPLCNILLCVYTIIILWVCHLLEKDTSYKKINLNKLFVLKRFKTGDLILFKSTDNLNSLYEFSYFTHIGIIIIDPTLTNNEPFIFEAACMNGKRNNKGINHNGICLSSLKNRIEKYQGYVYYKKLSKNITSDMHLKLINFIFYAYKNMSYNYNLIGSAFCKRFTKSKCNNKTNCAELIFLSLINMGLLDRKLWNQSIFHYLKYMTNLKTLNSINGIKNVNYYYLKPIELSINRIDSII